MRAWSIIAVMVALGWMLGPGVAWAEEPAVATPSETSATAPAGDGQPAPADAPTQGASAGPTAEDKADAEIGKSAAVEVEKAYPVVKDSPDLPRLEGVIERLKPFTQKPWQQYQVKVIDKPAVNAFSLPGGYLYFTKGLLGAVESDDELAAVAAHEMAHVCLNHSRRLISRNERYTRLLGAGVLAAVLSKSEGIDPGAVALVGSLVVQDALNHYGREAEYEADREAVKYLYASKRYHPVAMLTVAEGLARIEGSRPPVEMGALQTHPIPEERVAAIRKQLRALGVPIERRRVTRSLVASAAVVQRDDRELGEVRLNNRTLFQPAASVDGLSAAARAERCAEALNELLLADLQLVEISVEAQGERQTVWARQQALFAITPEDAAFHKTTVEQLAQQALAVFRATFQEEKVSRAY